MNKERLLAVADLMETIHNKKLPFDLRHFGGPAKDYDGEHICETSACACGYAALTKEFQDQGLSLREIDPRPDIDMLVKIRDVDHFNELLKVYQKLENDDEGYAYVSDFDAQIHYVDDEENEFVSWTAITQFFKLDSEEANYLFSDDEYPNRSNTTALEVAERIREFVNLINNFNIR